MIRRIGILLIASALVVAVHSNVLKCYICTSLLDEGCDSALTTNSLQPVECTRSNIIAWRKNKIKQYKSIKSYGNLLKGNKTIRHYRSTSQAMACVKVISNVTNVEVIDRMCYMEYTDPCETIEKMNNRLVKIKHCSLCFHDACNGTTVVSPEIFYTLLSFLVALIHAFYH